MVRKSAVRPEGHYPGGVRGSAGSEFCSSKRKGEEAKVGFSQALNPRART